MERRKFIQLTAASTAGIITAPQFLACASKQPIINNSDNILVFIQLTGGNDGLNTFIPYNDSAYYNYRRSVSIKRSDVIAKSNGMGFHPSLKGLAQLQQDGLLSIVQNVGYENANKSHFRSQEIWETASDSDEVITNGWLGRFMDVKYHSSNPTGAIHLGNVSSLALQGIESNFITIRNVEKFKSVLNSSYQSKLSGNPSLDFARKVAQNVYLGSTEIQEAYKKSKVKSNYPNTSLGKQLEWISNLIYGNLQSKIYYCDLGGFDTHRSQLNAHKNQLKQVDEAVSTFYNSLKSNNMSHRVTTVIFSEFGRRVKDNGSGTDHGKAAPMFIIGGNNKGNVLGNNPDLINLNDGDLQHQINFRSVYASLLKNKFDFDPTLLGIEEKSLQNLF